ncbi:MAG: aminotransferase [Alphaproteobacteria bacterium]
MPNTLTNADSLAAKDAAFLLHGYTDAQANARDGSLVIARGQGVRVWDENGTEYIETMGGLWCTALGFGEERLAQAAADQIRRLSFYHGFGGKSHPPQIELAERLIAQSPETASGGRMSKVFFANSGSEANDTAIKLAWFYNNARGRPEKRKIISRHKAYHGVTIAAASATGQPLNHTAFNLPLDGFLHTECAHHARGAAPGEGEEDYATRLAEILDALIEAEGPDTIAAFIAEPVMGAGGVLIPPRTYFEKIQRVLARHEILLIVDEVITGFGRTGNYWGCETFGIRPNILTAAKALSSGYQPISAVMVDDEVFDTIAPKTAEIGTFAHGFTYSGHPVPAAVAVETLKIYDEMDVVARVRAIGPMLQSALAGLADHPLTGEIAGVGLLGAVELVADKGTRALFPPAAHAGQVLVGFAQSHGLIMRALGDRIAFAPPVVIEPDDIDEIVLRFRRALDDLIGWAARRRDGN